VRRTIQHGAAEASPPWGPARIHHAVAAARPAVPCPATFERAGTCGWSAAIAAQPAHKDIPMPQFDATIKHIKDGVKGYTVKAAVSNIEGWEATLEKSDAPGVKTLVKDLENLKKHIQAEKPNGEQIKKLLAKLGKETVTLAGKSEGKNAEKAKALGEALTHMVDENGGHQEDAKAE
jgi:hypothetical protein